jgi:hypothetical protein
MQERLKVPKLIWKLFQPLRCQPLTIRYGFGTPLSMVEHILGTDLGLIWEAMFLGTVWDRTLGLVWNLHLWPGLG